MNMMQKTNEFETFAFEKPHTFFLNQVRHQNSTLFDSKNLRFVFRPQRSHISLFSTSYEFSSWDFLTTKKVLNGGASNIFAKHMRYRLFLGKRYPDYSEIQTWDPLEVEV